MNEEERVFEFIKQEQPVEQERIESQFGERGVGALRSLMLDDRISYGLEYRLVVNDE